LKKNEKRGLTSPLFYGILISEKGKGSPVSAEGKAAEGPEGLPNLKKKRR
jgi:hypothetical protein